MNSSKNKLNSKKTGFLICAKRTLNVCKIKFSINMAKVAMVDVAIFRKKIC